MFKAELQPALSFLNLAVAAGTGALLALLLIQRQRRLLKVLIAAFYLLVCYCLLVCWMTRSGIIAEVPGLLYSNYIAAVALGPIIYIYTERLLGRSVAPRRIFLMALPAFPMLGTWFAYHAAFPRSVAAAIGRGSPFPDLNREPVVYVACALAELSFVAYFLAGGLKVREAGKLCGRARAECLRRFSLLYLIGAGTYLAVFSGHMLDDWSLTTIASTANGFSILAYFLYIHKNPAITLRQIKIAGPAAREGPPREAEPHSKELLARLEKLMGEEKIYREAELTLPSLSARLGISPNQLSFILNNAVGVSFRTYINSRRLGEAKELLVRDGRSSILDIAFSVGFNSKTTFNTLFLQSTGMTPKEFRSKFSARLERKSFPVDI